MLIILAGSIGRLPVGGHAWVDMQYLVGLRALGHDVYYVEDCGEGSWVYNWETEALTTDLEYPTSYVRDCLREVGFDSRWIYRAGDESVGMPLDEFIDLCSEADLMILRGAALSVWRPEYQRPRRRTFIDSDPGFTQINLTNGKRDLMTSVNYCDHLFTIGQNIGSQGCLIPEAGRRWIKTLPPIALSYWPFVDAPGDDRFTTTMQWHSYPDVVFEGVKYGNKDREFSKFIELPSFTTQRLLLALTGASASEFATRGWEVVPGWEVSRTVSSYKEFIQESRAEFSVAKHGYVKMHTGWVSDRSICYLASGRPILVQETGLSEWMPTGEGVLTFSDLQGAIRGVEVINADYERQRHAARRLAEEFFAAERVLPPLLYAAMD
jgi:hypothetical protein